jgi:peptidyl-prolyl cis-trans isomerase SurA
MKTLGNAISFLSCAVLFAFFPALGSAQQNKDPILMTVGDSKVTVAEFESVYRKNSGKESNSEKKSLNEYVDLYTNFKLKVKEAEEMKLDTSAAFKTELAGYRKQLAQPYLTDKNVNESLLKEAYERKKLEVRSSHILIKCAENALPKDTLAAYTKIMGIRDMLTGKKGPKMEFDAAAKKYSEDPSAKDNGGDLGYFTAFDLVYPFETAVYTAKIGEISMPVRTRFGYHLIKVADRRPATGEVLVAHIMIKRPKGMTKEDSINSSKKMDEIYQKIKAGASFSDLAKQYSDDKASAPKGGELPWFGLNRMPPEFEKASFDLKNNGDVSEIIQTHYGWHIIKRIDRKSLASFDDMKAELKTKVAKDSRSQMGRSSMIAKIKGEYKFKDNFKLVEEFYPVIDSGFFSGIWKVAKAAKLNKVMFSLNDSKYTQADFAKYLEMHQSKRPKTDIKPVIDGLYKLFVDDKCIEYEEAHLDQKYPEFKALMQEYRDGILLFDLTDKKVWSKAVKDTVGLKEYYEKNKQNYLWEERADASIYTCGTEKIATEVKALLKKKKTDKFILDEMNKNSQLNLQIESKAFLPKENSFVDANWSPGTSANKTENGKIIFVVVNKLLKPEPKAFNESKGLVTADYQNFLEKEWIDSLRNKYPVTVNKEVLSTIQ